MHAVFRSRATRRAVGLVVASLTVGALASAAPAPASAKTAVGLSAQQIKSIYRPGPRVHTLPKKSYRDKIATSTSGAAATNLLYHGGQIMTAGNHAVPIFWQPPTLQNGAVATVDPNYNALIQRYFSDVGGNGLYQVNTQYYDIIAGTQTFIVNSANLLVAVVDTSPYPAPGPGCSGNGTTCVDDAQIQAEITKVINANALPKNKSTMYFVFLAGGESTCYDTVDCFRTAGSNGSNFVFCAYHGSYTLAGQPVIYANMPYGASAYLNECTSLSAFPNNAAADIVLSTTSHEQMEAVTDPFLDAWYDATGAENGDKCAYNYGARTLDGGLANESWNGHFYVLQQEWSNASTSCSLGLPVGGSPTISVGDASTTEGNSGTKVLNIPVTLSQASASSVSFQFATSNGTATAGSDYVAKTNTRTFAAGVTSLTLSVTINGDTVVEPNETFNINLSNPVGATIADGLGVETITNDDVAAGPTLVINDLSIVEGNAGTKALSFTVTLSAAQAGTVTVHYATANGTATAGSDYVAKSGTASFAPGILTRHIVVNINGDTTIESNETLFVNLSAAVGATIADAQGIGTITNDD